MSQDAFAATWVDHVDAVPAWLWRECFASELEGAWLYRVLETSGLDEQFRFRYLVLRQGDRLVGIAPTFLMDVPLALVVPPVLGAWVSALGRVIPWLRSQRTHFVGSPIAERGQIGLLAGVDRLAALRCIAATLRHDMRKSGARMALWKDFANLDDDVLETLARESGLFPLVSFPGTVVDLPFETKEAYFQSLRGSQRHLFKKKLRRSHEQVHLSVNVIRQPNAATMTELFALFQQTYEKSKIRFERLNLRFFELAAAEATASFIVLREPMRDEAVAFMLCFEVGGQMINKFIGIDYRRPRDWFLYFRLWDAAVERALSIGAGSVLSGQTGYRPKLELGHRLVPLTNYVAHRNPLIHRLYRSVASKIDWHTLDPSLAAALLAHPELRRPARSMSD